MRCLSDNCLCVLVRKHCGVYAFLPTSSVVSAQCMFGRPPWLVCVPTGELFPVSINWTEFYLLAQASDSQLDVEEINLSWGRLGITCREGCKFVRWYLPWKQQFRREFELRWKAAEEEAEADIEDLELLQIVLVNGGDNDGAWHLALKMLLWC